MPRMLKVVLILVSIIVLLFVIDVVCVFIIGRPFFSIKGSSENMYNGLFYDVYNCDEYSIPQIKAKGAKFSCLVDNDLNKVNNKIIEYFSNNETSNYENYVFNYVDKQNQVVVVGLLDNSKEEQEKFKEIVVNSNLIKFVKSEKLTLEDNNQSVQEFTFIRTYNILNIANSNDKKYLYLTIRQFQDEEVQTVKVEKSLCPSIEVGKNYEFFLKTHKKIEDNILSIFNNSTIISIKETNKIGLEQIQDSI